MYKHESPATADGVSEQPQTDVKGRDRIEAMELLIQTTHVYNKTYLFET